MRERREGGWRSGLVEMNMASGLGNDGELHSAFRTPSSFPSVTATAPNLAMVALALSPIRTLLPSLSQFSLRRSFVAASIIPSFFFAPRGNTSLIPSLWDTLADLFPSILMAVPKKKISHSRKSMRSANKGLKDKQNLVHCPACGAPKLAHHLCAHCYSEISRRWKREALGKGEFES